MSRACGPLHYIYIYKNINNLLFNNNINYFTLIQEQKVQTVPKIIIVKEDFYWVFHFNSGLFY